MKIVFSREDVQKIVVAHVCNLLQASEANFDVTGPSYSSGDTVVELLDQPKQEPAIALQVVGEAA